GGPEGGLCRTEGPAVRCRGFELRPRVCSACSRSGGRGAYGRADAKIRGDPRGATGASVGGAALPGRLARQRPVNRTQQRSMRLEITLRGTRNFDIVKDG